MLDGPDVTTFDGAPDASDRGETRFDSTADGPVLVPVGGAAPEPEKAPESGGRRKRLIALAAAILLVLVVATAALASGGGDDGGAVAVKSEKVNRRTGGGASLTTTTSSTTTTTTTTTTTAPPAVFPGGTPGNTKPKSSGATTPTQPVTQPPTQPTAPPVPAPTVSISGPSTVCAGQNSYFTGNATNAVSGTWALPGFNFQNTAWTPGTPTQFVNPAAGAVGSTHTWTLTVRNSAGATATASKSFTVVSCGSGY